MAGPSMSSTDYSLPRSAYDAGASTGSSASYQLIDAFANEQPLSGRAASASYSMWPGAASVFSFPAISTGITLSAGVTSSSFTLEWTSPGYDGNLGSLQTGSTFFIVVASYTTPSIFSLPYAVAVATSGVKPGAWALTPETGLLPNTTYFAEVWTSDALGDPSFASAMSTFTMLALAPTALAGEFTNVYYSSVAVAWAALNASPPDGSSTTCEGYLVQASSTDFGALAPPEAVFPSSATPNVLASTLTISGLLLSNTYYFRVASYNWNGSTNTTNLGPLDFQISPSTVGLSFGTINISGGPTSEVSASSVVITNSGNWPTTLQIWAATSTAGGSPWTLSTTAANDAPVLEGLFNTTQPSGGSFSTVITGSTVTATASVLAGNETAVQIPPGQSRALWFEFFTPTSTSVTTKQTFQLSFQAVYP